MPKLSCSATLLLFGLFIPHAATAGIIGVLTESSASATVLRLDDSGVPRVVSYTGAQISESFGSVALGSASSFDTTSRVGPGVVEFQNGNAAFGEGVVSVSRTVVDIFYENSDGIAVTPVLNSQITPAGLGIFVSGCHATDLRECSSRDAGDYDWQDVGNLVEAGEAAVGTHFDFKVVAGNDELFGLSGGLSLVLGDDGEQNEIVQDFGEVQGFLNDFRQTSPDGTEQQITFDWSATDFEVEFPDYLTLAPGETGSVRYITEVTTFSNAVCFDAGLQSCPVAYGSFGDPIGRGGAGGSRNTDMVSQLLSTGLMNTPSVIEGLEFGRYDFNFPTFEDGVITFRAFRGPGINDGLAVPAPPPFGLIMLCIVLLVLYRARQ